jgi:long-chain acyl-CoA synthetase
MNTTYGLHRALLLNRDGFAVSFENHQRTWAKIGDRVARLAGALASIGVARGDRIAVLMLNQDRYLELYLAVAWAGAVIVPLNIRWSAFENEDALRDCRPKVLVIDAAFAKIAVDLAHKIEGLTVVYADDPAIDLPSATLNYETILAGAQPVADAGVPDTDLAGIFYTGGTTARSKGVMLSHRNLLSNARNLQAEGLAGENATYLHVAPMFHLANASLMYLHFFTVSRHAFVRMFTPDGVARAIEQHGVTEMLLVPTMIQMLVDHPVLDTYDLVSLRRIMYGASPISEALLERAMKKLPNVHFLQGYGMTELSPTVTILPWKDHIGEGRAKGRHRSCGRPTFMVDVRIVDADDKPVPTGVVGEICARGETVMMGYWERPEETRNAVIDGWMHTGDGGYMDKDGYVYIVDRIKDMIISGGENIYSAEVENCIAKHPAVVQCAAIGIPSEKWGEAVHAVIVRKPGAEVTSDEIIAFCKERIAGYKCPRSVEIRGETLPLSGAGKILKRELRAPYWQTKRAVN